MRSTRWAAALAVLSLALVALAASAPKEGKPATLLENVAVGDHVTLSTNRDGDSYRIRLLEAEALEELREKESQYSAMREQYDAKRKELEEVRTEYFRESDREKRAELAEKLRGLTPPRRAEAVYRVSFVGKDYLAVARDGYEVLVPLSAIRDVRRTVDRPES